MPAHVSAAHAARMYGRSEKTVRRWIAAGKLPAEKIDGSYLVDLDDVARLAGDVSAPPTAPVSATSTDSVSAPGVDDDVRTDEGDVRPSQLAQAEAISTLVQTTVAAVLGPLVAELAASRQTIERQTDQLVGQAETIGQLRSENAALVASTTPEPAPANIAPTVPRWRSWGLWLLVVAVLVAVIVVGWPPGWPR